MSAGKGTPFRRLRRRADRHRRLLAAVCAALAVTCTLGVLRPPAPERVEVLAAARDLPGGTTLQGSQLTTVSLRPEVIPEGALRPGATVRGKVLAGPMRAGEPLTDAALVGSSPLKEGLVATPLRIADPEVARLLHAGDRVDVLAASMRPGAAGSGEETAPDARVVASSVRVLSVPAAGDDSRYGMDTVGGALIVLAATPEQAAALAGAAATARLSVTIHPQ